MTDNGKTDQLKGKAKEVYGDVTGNEEKKAEGHVDQAVGKGKEFAHDVKETAEGLMNEGKKKTDEFVEKTKEKFHKK